MSQIELTLKSREVEEPIDLYFFRPIGYDVTRLLQPTSIHPTHVTLTSIVIGMVAGHLLYYDDLGTNIVGMIAFVIADLLDSVDGQLARLKGLGTRFGRILDGLGGAFIFTSIHFHLALRLYHGGAGRPIFLLALVALLSLALQTQMVDYFRLAYVTYGLRNAKSGLDSANKLRREYDDLKRNGSVGEKLLHRIYLSYTARQEILTPHFQRFRQAQATASFNEQKLERLAANYRSLNRPVITQNAWIATNIRMLIAFALIFLRRIVWIFWFETIVLNLIMVVLIALHERNSRRLLAEISQTG